MEDEGGLVRLFTEVVENYPQHTAYFFGFLTGAAGTFLVLEYFRTAAFPEVEMAPDPETGRAPSMSTI